VDDDDSSDDDDAVDDDDSATEPSACTAFCATAATTCTASNEQWATTVACEADCAGWPLGTPSDVAGDSLACRAYHLGVAAADPAVHCPHAGPTGGGVCQ
jgi:hypothetical protein